MKERWQNQLQCFFPPQEMALLHPSTRLPLHHPPRSSTQTYTLPCPFMHKFPFSISWTFSPFPKCMACVDSSASKVHSRPNSFRKSSVATGPSLWGPCTSTPSQPSFSPSSAHSLPYCQSGSPWSQICRLTLLFKGTGLPVKARALSTACSALCSLTPDYWWDFLSYFLVISSECSNCAKLLIIAHCVLQVHLKVFNFIVEHSWLIILC